MTRLDRSGLPARTDRIVVMGVLNVTPDSFSDGGRYTDLDEALDHARTMAAEGADLIDVGGESTRPGAERVPAEEEARRVLPVIGQLAQDGLLVSVDTYRAAVAELALATGAAMVNDVSGGLGDPDMARVVRDADCPWILMHWRGHSRDMNSLACYDDVVADVRAELLARVDAALAAGVLAERLVIDPGLGFAKQAEHNWALLARFEALTSLGLPVLLGASRKSFLGRLLADIHGTPRPSWAREDATVALTTFAALNQAWGVRVHQVRPNVDAALTAAALQAANRKYR
ncbi:MAG: dihydropteroate synthase [Jatrophihabitantaceae bacterium]